jgi:hypothetical protein
MSVDIRLVSDLESLILHIMPIDLAPNRMGGSFLDQILTGASWPETTMRHFLNPGTPNPRPIAAEPNANSTPPHREIHFGTPRDFAIRSPFPLPRTFTARYDSIRS